ncbi:hypothetical protein vseg_016840 [Gypsophila vaccaria]
MIQLSQQASAEVTVTLPPLPSYATPPPPACLAKVMECLNEYIKNIDITAEPKPICCPEWKDLIENDRKCYCDTVAPSIATTNATQIEKSLKFCKIDASPDTLCLGANVNGATSGTKWVGTISGPMLLFAGLLLF